MECSWDWDGRYGRTDLLGAKIIQRRHEDGERSVDSHDPRKRTHIITHAQKDCWSRNHFPSTHNSFIETTSLFPAVPLFNTQ
jgi:hypothetical protein